MIIKFLRHCVQILLKVPLVLQSLKIKCSQALVVGPTSMHIQNTLSGYNGPATRKEDLKLRRTSNRVVIGIRGEEMGVNFINTHHMQYEILNN